MKQMATDKGVNWMAIMLDYCKYVFLFQYSKTILKNQTFRKETEEIKMQLQVCRREKQTVEGLYSNSEKEMAK